MAIGNWQFKFYSSHHIISYQWMVIETNVNEDDDCRHHLWNVAKLAFCWGQSSFHSIDDGDHCLWINIVFPLNHRQRTLVVHWIEIFFTNHQCWWKFKKRKKERNDYHQMKKKLLTKCHLSNTSLIRLMFISRMEWMNDNHDKFKRQHEWNQKKTT